MLDASSIIHAWDEYPIDQFPKLWKWLAAEIGRGQLAICSIAFGEVSSNSPECADWLEEAGIQKFGVTNAILVEANKIKVLLEIAGDKFHGDGVGENDLIIIAAAKIHGATLISEEASQKSLPKIKAKFKIPAVCSMSEVGVDCLKFSRYFKASKQVF